ncbi:MAG: TIM barrel protein [Clostridia bacterium]|nr:TIM barrel protein [Clostridia bacterium]
MHIGFTSTTFRNIKSVEKIVNIAVSCDAECIEWGGDIHVTDFKTAKKVKKLCDEAKIRICSYGSYYRVGSCDKDEWRRICGIASELGASSIRVWLGKNDSEKTDESKYKKLVDDAKSICNVASRYGLIVCPECHDNTYNNDTDAFIKIRNEIGCDNFGTYFQSRYKKKAYDLDRIERTLPYIKTVHISYSEQLREQFPKHDPSYIDSLLDKLIETGFNGDILIEYTHLFSYAGIPSCLKKDIIKLKEKLGDRK